MKRTIMAGSLGLMLFAAGCGGGGTAPTAPTVLSTTATSDRLSTTSPVSVTFSAAMDQASVEAALQITGSGPVAGALTWAGNTVTFTPQALWKTHHPYTLTIQNTAKDAQGTAMAAAFTQVFRPGINLNDVNGDGIDDIIASAPLNDEAGLDAGMVYLFLGKTTWLNLDLATQTADAQYNVAGTNLAFGHFTTSVGDINGDGYADIVAGAPAADLGGTDRGLVAVLYGSASPTSRTYASSDMDVDYFVASEDTTSLGMGVYAAGDVNGDGLADFVVAGQLPPGLNDFQFWLVFGQTAPYGAATPITSAADAHFTVSGDLAFASQMYRSCDVNGDELDDIVLTAPGAAGGGTDRGQVYYIAGSASPASLDLIAQPGSASAVFTGAQDDNALGRDQLCSCADINGDGYDDLLMAAPGTSGGKGTAYLVLGSAQPASIDFSTGSASATFVGTSNSRIGYGLSVPGDVNNDGYNDMLIAAPFKPVSAVDMTGQAYLFFGAATPASVDLETGGSASATYTGQIPPAGKPTAFGFSRPFGDVNGDGIDDMVMNAIGAPNGTGRGVLYIVFGSAQPASLDFNTQSADVTITGHADKDYLNVQAPL